MSRQAKILRIDPLYGTAGGEIIIDCENFDTSDPDTCEVLFGETTVGIVALGPTRILATVPDEHRGGSVQVSLRTGDFQTDAVSFFTGRKLATDLHPVANPAFDPEDGSLFVTRSGSRGEELPVTLFRIDVSGDLIEYSGDIPNPTGIAFSPDGEMFVSSRLDGTIYRVNPFKDAVAFARNLGVATGIAFDSNGVMHVGDRKGTIFSVNGIGDEKWMARLE